MGAVQRLATVVIVGLVALATVLVLYVADESNRIDATALQQRDDGIERATANFISLCMTCHGPAGLGYTGPDAKTADGQRTSRIGALLGGENTVLNHTGLNAKGTPWPGQTELGVTYAGGFAGRTAWITNRITNGLLTADGKSYIMPAFSEAKGGPLNDSQIQELVWLIQYGDWNKVYNQAIKTAGGYPTPGPGPSTTTPTAAAATTPAATGGSTAAAAPLNLDLEDIKFSTDSLQITANTDSTIHITNKGGTVHNFNIDELNIHSGDVAPGASVDVKINAAAGSYTYYCNIPGHEAAGMKGTLTVVSGGAAPAAGAASPSANAGAAPLSLDLEDIKFSTDTLQAQSNVETTIHITNTGATVHNFNIDELNVHSGDVQPGASVDVKINAAAGTYTYYCNIPGHEAAGMKGVLTVADGAPAGAASSPAAGAAAPASTQPPAAAAPAGVVDVEMVDIAFKETTLEVPANVETTLHITNTGSTTHNFSIDELKINTGDVAPGASVDVKVNAPAGTYKYYCNVPGHEAAGMVGELTVK